MTQVAVRLDDEELAELDRLVQLGVYPSRAAGIRAALAAQRRAEKDRNIAAAYRQAYGQCLPSDTEAGVGVGRSSIAEFYGDESEWSDDKP